MRRLAKELVTGAGGAALIAALACSPPVRRRSLTYGATPEEIARTMPGDELLPEPGLVSTRGITIDAPPAAVWPWLRYSTDRILPRFAHPAVGAVLPDGRGAAELRVAVSDPQRVLAYRSADGTWLWIFGLYWLWGGTRLISRNRISVPPASIGRRLVDRVVLEPGSLVMERRMLAGIRDRAESYVPPPAYLSDAPTPA
jgi:hypothetical protein